MTTKSFLKRTPIQNIFAKSGQIEVIETSQTKAISTLYASIFKNFTRYSGHAIIDWNEIILETLNMTLNFFQ